MGRSLHSTPAGCALDGQENPAAVILTNNVAQVNNHLAMTEHAYSTVFLVMSPETWASFDDETKETFKRVMAGVQHRGERNQS
ncbi:MAG: hypothetical protein ACLUAR_10185 [Pilosibacter sp.]